MADKKEEKAVSLSCEMCGKPKGVNAKRFCGRGCFAKWKSKGMMGDNNPAKRLEVRKRISEGKKGQTPWNKNKTGVYSKEILETMSKIKMGKKQTDETKEKISEANKGRKFSEEHRKKIGKAMEGDNNPSKRPEVRKKISDERIGKYPKEYYQNLGITSVMKQNRMKGPTSIEKKVYDELKSRGILFERQKLIKGKFIVDAYIPSLNLVIEADGDYWHNRDDVKKRDKAKNAYLKKCGFGLLRMTGTEINNGSFKEMLDKEIN